MHVDFTPFTRPLSGLMDEFKRYGVLITDSRQARIFTLYLGEIETSQDVFIQDEVPDRVRVKASMASGRGQVMSGLGDQRIQRHIEDHVHRHLKNVADQAFTLFKSSGFERLILASTEAQLISKLYDHLHSYLQERCVAQFTADPRDNWDQLRQKALETAQSWEREHEVEIIDHLLEESNSGGKAVLGVEPVLEALIFGQVHTLVLEHNIQLGGSVCDEDRTLSTYLDTCPLCGQPMRQTEDLTEELVEEALGQNAEVEHVFVTHEDFKPYGIGAFLRFTM
jgi:peptide chain release factor subunit 1